MRYPTYQRTAPRLTVRQRMAFAEDKCDCQKFPDDDCCTCCAGGNPCCDELVADRTRPGSRPRRRGLRPSSSSSSMVLGAWAGVADSSAVGYCNTRWPDATIAQKVNCANIIKTGQDPSRFMAGLTPLIPAPAVTEKPPWYADILGGAAKIFAGGVVGAQQSAIQQGQAAMLAQQQAQAQAKQMQMLIIGGAAALGLILYLRKR